MRGEVKILLIQESELNTYNSDAIIDEAVILDESESIIKLPAIPVVENTRLDCGLVHINDLDSIVEDYDCSYEDAFCAIAEQNELDPDNLAVIVEDYSIIETPELVDLVPNIVVKPISEDNAIYQFCDYAVSALDEGYLTEEEFNDIMLDELSLKGNGKIQSYEDIPTESELQNTIKVSNIIVDKRKKDNSEYTDIDQNLYKNLEVYNKDFKKLDEGYYELDFNYQFKTISEYKYSELTELLGDQNFYENNENI